MSQKPSTRSLSMTTIKVFLTSAAPILSVVEGSFVYVFMLWPLAARHTGVPSNSVLLLG